LTKAELGTKRVCPNCGAKYYDLNRSPIVCPRCGTQFEAPTARTRPQAAKVAAVVEEEEVIAEAPEVISLGEADEEAADSGQVKIEGDAEADGDEEEAEIETAEDDTFLAEEDEDDEDVGDIIGEVDEEER
jgi:uncharacterized protein (TIGR02300 family)